MRPQSLLAAKLGFDSRGCIFLTQGSFCKLSVSQRVGPRNVVVTALNGMESRHKKVMILTSLSLHVRSKVKCVFGASVLLTFVDIACLFQYLLENLAIALVSC